MSKATQENAALDEETKAFIAEQGVLKFIEYGGITLRSR